MSLRLDTILSRARDFEKRQFLILQGLRDYSGHFSQNRLYPSLSELVDLYGTMQDLMDKHDDLASQLPQDLKDVDIENQQLIYEASEEPDQNIHEVVALIVWALPRVKEVMEEGVQIHNFVDENIDITEVGITPLYRDEGYWFVPDGRNNQLNLLRYEVSLFSSASERYRTLKTRVLESIEQDSPLHSTESIKLMLIKKYQDLPNPATYACETDLDFPYGETILPVAKRKLMERLFS